jgi:imidazolonepropionase-like amidohydrolase
MVTIFKEFASMKRYVKSLSAMAVVLSVVGCGPAPEKANNQPQVSDTSYFFGARIIPGDGSPAMEDMSFITKAGKITTIGKRSEVTPPKGSNRIELTGRTVVPVFINLQAQPGMNNGAQYGPKNYNRESLTADLSRYAYYGVMAVVTAGTDGGELPFSVRDELRQGKIKGARLLTAGRGIAAKGGGPAGASEVMIPVANATDAKRAVDDLAEQKVDAIKLWMDDGNGKGAKLKSDAYAAAIDEAHKKNLKVFAEVFDLADAKDLVKAGIDGFVSSIRDREVDDALIAAMKEKNVVLAPALTAAEAKFIYADKPNWLGEQTMREVYPAQLAGYLADQVSINKFKRNPELGALRQQYETALKNLKKLSGGGVKIALGTNSGSADTYPGYFELREMIAMADAGMSPMDVIKAATSVPAEVMGLQDMGTFAVGKNADFLSMPNSPLEKMANIKDLGQLYLSGSEQERSALIEKIQINTQTLKITDKDREKDAREEAEAARKAAEDKLPHYGGMVQGPSVSVRYMSIPTPKGSKADAKSGPPDRITVSMAGAGPRLRGFYADILPKYSWKSSGNCWEREHPQSKKSETLCIEASKDSAVLQISEK